MIGCQWRRGGGPMYGEVETPELLLQTAASCLEIKHHQEDWFPSFGLQEKLLVLHWHNFDALSCEILSSALSCRGRTDGCLSADLFHNPSYINLTLKSSMSNCFSLNPQRWWLVEMMGGRKISVDIIIVLMMMYLLSIGHVSHIIIIMIIIISLLTDTYDCFLCTRQWHRGFTFSMLL